MPHETDPKQALERARSQALPVLSLLLSLGFPLFSLDAQALRSDSPEFRRGRELSEKYCAACHLWPAPELLDVETWRNGTKPLMKSRLGIAQLDPSKPAEKQVLEEWELIWN